MICSNAPLKWHGTASDGTASVNRSRAMSVPPFVVPTFLTMSHPARKKKNTRRTELSELLQLVSSVSQKDSLLGSIWVCNREVSMAFGGFWSIFLHPKGPCLGVFLNFTTQLSLHGRGTVSKLPTRHRCSTRHTRPARIAAAILPPTLRRKTEVRLRWLMTPENAPAADRRWLTGPSRTGDVP